MILYDAFDLGNWSWTISTDAILLWVAAFLVLGIGILYLVDFVNKKGQNDLIWFSVFIGLFLTIYMVATTGSWEDIFTPYFGSIGNIVTSIIYLAIPGLVATAILRKMLGKEKLGNILLLCTVGITFFSMLMFMDASNGQWEFVPLLARIAQLSLIIPSALVMIVVPLKKKTDNKAGLVFAIGCILLASVFLILAVVGLLTALDGLADYYLGVTESLLDTQGNLVDFVVSGLPFLILGSGWCFFDSLIIIPKKWKNMEVA